MKTFWKIGKQNNENFLENWKTMKYQNLLEKREKRRGANEGCE
jgi:hypothetical protein